jgi:hypothetical protein
MRLAQGAFASVRRLEKDECVKDAPVSFVKGSKYLTASFL